MLSTLGIIGKLDHGPGTHRASPISELRGLDKIKVSKYYPRGSVLFAEGEKARGVYLLCEGRVKVSISSPEGKTFVLRMADTGEWLGMNGTLIGGDYLATVETLERCRIAFFSRDDFMELLERDKGSYLNVAQCLSQQLTGLVEHTRMLLLSQSASEKVARLLLEWSMRHGQRTTRGIQISRLLTHEEMAQMISTSRETVTRVLNSFKRKQLIRAENGSWFILNLVALKALANGGSHFLDKCDINHSHTGSITRKMPSAPSVTV